MKLNSFLYLTLLFLICFPLNSYSASLSSCNYIIVVKTNLGNFELPNLFFSSLGKNSNASNATTAASSAMKNCIWAYKGRSTLPQNCDISANPSYGKGVVTASYSKEYLTSEIKNLLCDKSQTKYSFTKVILKAKQENTKCDFMKGEFELMDSQSGLCK